MKETSTKLNWRLLLSFTLEPQFESSFLNLTLIVVQIWHFPLHISPCSNLLSENCNYHLPGQKYSCRTCGVTRPVPQTASLQRVCQHTVTAALPTQLNINTCFVQQTIAKYLYTHTTSWRLSLTHTHTLFHTYLTMLFTLGSLSIHKCVVQSVVNCSHRSRVLNIGSGTSAGPWIISY